MSIDISIIEDDAPLRNILAQWIVQTAGFHLASVHADALNALAVIPKLKPQAILMDIKLPGMSGIECIRRLRPLLPSAQIVVLTVYEDADYIFEALAAGAVSYLIKRSCSSRRELVAAIHEVQNGGSPMTSSIARRVVQTFQHSPAAQTKPACLARQEQQVLHLLAKGYLYKEIADALAISPGTVNTYIRRIYEKLQVHSRTQALLKLSSRT